MTPPNKLDLYGQMFGRLVVLNEAESQKRWETVWQCLCACGNVKKVRAKHLRSGQVTSCGCRQGGFTHGMTKTRIYRVWCQMRRRCSTPNDRGWHLYGGRGITVCERWQSFNRFYADMGDPPPSTSLDRIDNDGPYSPENCRWATNAEQARNKRSNVFLTYGGITQTITDWARAKGIKESTLHGRYQRGVRPPALWLGEEGS
jgi:hypothetical protein